MNWYLRAQVSTSTTARLSVVNLPIQKINYLPLLPGVRPPEVHEKKTFSFQPGKPLSMTVSLDRDVYRHFDPIVVKVYVFDGGRFPSPCDTG